MQKGAWDTGYRKYQKDIFIFANIGVSGRTGHDYDNQWEGSDLVWYGKTASNLNQPLIQQMINGSGIVYIFTRTDDRQPFTYQGEGIVKSYEDISPVKIIWTFKKSRFINVPEAWQILVKNAQKLYNTQEIYVSPKQQHQYKIIKADSNQVRIRRLSVKNQTETTLTYKVFEGVITKINKSQGRLSRREFYSIVIVEASIVWLLPMLDWDNDFKNIIVGEGMNVTAIEKVTNNSLIEAKDDLEFRTITRDLRIRRGQNKLRENLFYLYEAKCCLTRFAIKELLHACHIIPHSHSGINSTANALLFRADIHDLFDSNLMGINPKTLEAVPHKILNETEYSNLKGVRICDRIDGKRPDFNALSYRWDIFNSTK